MITVGCVFAFGLALAAEQKELNDLQKTANNKSEKLDKRLDAIVQIFRKHVTKQTDLQSLSKTIGKATWLDPSMVVDALSSLPSSLPVDYGLSSPVYHTTFSVEILLFDKPNRYLFYISTEENIGIGEFMEALRGKFQQEKTKRITIRPPATVRCAIYTRKSTEVGLEQNFNSLDAQREACLAYIQSQRHEGWKCLPARYDDGGFTGGNMDRPALKRLLADIEAGQVDCVVCYKLDRLSRSLLDFARIIGIFEKHHVSFVSITQQFNSATSMGRLVLNVLLSFAQFEREIATGALHALCQGTVNSDRESERLLGYFGELGELLPWFAARALA